MLRVSILTHAILNGILWLLGPVPAILLTVGHAVHTVPGPNRPPTPARVIYAALGLLIVGIAIGRLISRFVIVARCPDCGGTGQPEQRPEVATVPAPARGRVGVPVLDMREVPSDRLGLALPALSAQPPRVAIPSGLWGSAGRTDGSPEQTRR